MSYKASIYNNIYTKGEVVYMWNSYSNALVKMDVPTYEKFQSKALEPEIGMQLLNNGILVREDRNEYEEVKDRAAKFINSDTPDNLVLVIAPTLACNYKCVYCFENGRESYCSMNEKVVAQVNEFVSRKVKSLNHLKKLSVTWFGGEPLLAFPVIKTLSDSFISLCEEQGIEYRANIITNGRHLTEDKAKAFSELNIKRVQISFDGTEDVYCQKKLATSEDYRITVENIMSAARYLDNIILRVNISDSNFGDAYKLVDEFLGEMGLAGKIKISPACTIEGTSEERQKRYREYVKEERKLREYIETKYGSDSYHVRIPCSRGAVCTLASKNNFVIGPEGELYKCEHHVGQKDLEVGHIKEVEVGHVEDFEVGSIEEVDNEKIKVYESICSSVAGDSKCKTCSVYPVCMGGCPNSYLEMKQNFDCESYRERAVKNAILPRI